MIGVKFLKRLASNPAVSVKTVKAQINFVLSEVFEILA